MTFPLRMHHPLHGWMHVYNSSEQTKHEERGWKPDPEEQEPAIAAVEAPKPRGRSRKVA